MHYTRSDDADAAQRHHQQQAVRSVDRVASEAERKGVRGREEACACVCVCLFGWVSESGSSTLLLL